MCYLRNRKLISVSCLIVVFFFFLFFQYDPPMTIIYDTARKKEPPPPASQYFTERDLCIKYFDQWSEKEQIHFVECLLSRMCHHQQSQINAFLKPILKRDFISLLPSTYFLFSSVAISSILNSTHDKS